ncbi:Transcription factor bHLH96 [Linum perenne]
MAQLLEAAAAVIYSLDTFGFNFSEQYYGLLDQNTCINNASLQLGILHHKMNHQHLHGSSSSTNYLGHSSSPEPFTPAAHDLHHQQLQPEMVDQPVETRRKRRRTKSTKNKDEIENQRMTHIAVERNRRKQMNHYLSVLRSLMPPSYVQRGDQASIIGGAINFVKELEHILQSMEDHKTAHLPSSSSSSMFSEFFTFPQYSITGATKTTHNPQVVMEADSDDTEAHNFQVAVAPLEEAVGDIEVTMVESHGNVKILVKKQPRQLIKLLAMMQNLRFTILHLNVTTTAHQMVLYSLTIKLEEGCHLNTVDEIAAAVNEMLRQIQVEAAAF